MARILAIWVNCPDMHVRFAKDISYAGYGTSFKVFRLIELSHLPAIL